MCYVLQHLQLIEKSEKEAALEAAHLVKKTHKGDQAVGEEDLSDLTQGVSTLNTSPRG